MPKDATKNVDRYKIRGGQLNEFDYTKNQEEFAERGTKVTKPAKGPTAIKAAATKGTKSRKTTKGVSAKKSATRKGAKK
jgi:hypothetical protein